MATVGGSAALAAAKRLAGVRSTPYRSCNFLVEISGLVVAGFTEVSGLSATIDVETVREGGVNSFEHKVPNFTSYADIEMKHGMAEFDFLWNWFYDASVGKVKRRNGTIFLLNNSFVPAMWWDFVDAWPVSWEGPTFNAGDAFVAIQSFTLAHHGVTRPLSSQAVTAGLGVAGAVGGLLT